MESFENIIAPHKEPNMKKVYKPQVALEFDNYLNPQTLKEHVLHSDRVRDIINTFSQAHKCDRLEMERHVRAIIDEIGLERNLAIIRMCGMAITAIGKRICESINVNKKNIERIKAHLGKHPVLYLPSHRSYMDFILMSYICFHYDIEIPGIAAGMDFHSMFGMGTMLRKTGAFFMRRSFSNDELYWEIFREYMYALVANYHIGVEFFIEGTRSRCFKALQPKIGLLSMALLPYFNGEVSDIIVVPISISYDRVLEEQLFVYELLGVPKPKETTKGFFKALKILEQQFGSMYVDFGPPISVHKFFMQFQNNVNIATDQRLQRATFPRHLQKLNKNEIEAIKQLATKIVDQQQRGIVLNIFNMMCLYYACELYNGRQEYMTLDNVKNAVKELENIFIKLGANVASLTQNEYQIMSVLQVHQNIMELKGINLHLRDIPVEQLHQQIDVQKLKGHTFNRKTMIKSVPILSLQFYINPLLFWLTRPAFLLLAAMRLKCEQKNIKHLTQLIGSLQNYSAQLENFFKYEFVINTTREAVEFERNMQFLQQQQLIKINEENLKFEVNVEDNLCGGAILAGVAPFLCLYYQLAVTLNELPKNKSWSPQKILIQLQQKLEIEILNTTSITKINNNRSFVHPYCLALDNLHIALNFFTQSSYLLQNKENKRLQLNVEKPLHPIVNELHLYCSLLPFKQYMLPKTLHWETAKL